MSCCEVCRQTVNAQLQLPSGNQGTCLTVYIKIRKGLGTSFTLEQVLQVSRSLQFCATGSLTHLHGENYEASFYIFLSLLAFAAESQVDGTPRTLVPSGEVWGTQRLPDVVLTALVVSLWVFLYLVFLLEALLYLHYNLRVSAVIKEQRGWSCVDNNNPADSRTKKGGVKDLIALAQWNSWFWGGARTLLGAPAEGSPWTPQGNEIWCPWRHWGGRTMNQPQRVGMSAWAARLKHPQESPSPGFLDLETLPEELFFPRRFSSGANYIQEKRSMKWEWKKPSRKELTVLQALSSERICLQS